MSFVLSVQSNKLVAVKSNGLALTACHVVILKCSKSSVLKISHEFQRNLYNHFDWVPCLVSERKTTLQIMQVFHCVRCVRVRRFDTFIALGFIVIIPHAVEHKSSNATNLLAQCPNEKTIHQIEAIYRQLYYLNDKTAV